MYQSSTTFSTNYLRVSLQAARVHLRKFLPKLKNKSNVRRQKVDTIILGIIADSYEKKRVDRVQSRVRKRRPKAYPGFATTSSNSSGQNESFLR